MIRLVTTLLLATLAHGAFAQGQTEERTIERARSVYQLTLSLNENTVRCLRGDYVSNSLKISVPELRGLTAFPQTTAGETAPCINAGSCRFEHTPDGRQLDPSLILDPNRPTETVDVTVVLNEVLSIDHKLKFCLRRLSEDVSASVRGLEFRHSDGLWLGQLDYNLCLALH